MQIPSSHKDRSARESDVMTSMIDVVFLLLIFFVVAAAGQKREASLATTFAQSPAMLPAQRRWSEIHG